MFRFLHAADIHLDTAPQGLHHSNDALRQVTRRAFVNLVDLALQEKIDLLLLAGDLYNGDWNDYHTGLFFLQQMRRLHSAQIPVALIAGNHDAANRMTKKLQLPPNVHFFREDIPGTHRLEHLRVAIHGQSFATQAVTEDLSLNYPAPVMGFYNIGLLHTCVSGREGHERYAPCVLEDLKAKGYDYWALGHIHKREVLSEDPPIVFPGNLQGRHIRETGPKGCYLVSAHGPGRSTLEFRCLDVLRWEILPFDASGIDEPRVLLDRLERAIQAFKQATPLPLAIRLQLHGKTSLYRNLLADTERWTHQIQALAEGQVFLEKVHFAIEAEGAPLLPGDGPWGELHRHLEELSQSEDKILDIVKTLPELADLSKKLQQQTGEGLPLQDVVWLQEILAEVGPLLTERLLGSGAKP